jgi:hypothetical protein
MGSGHRDEPFERVVGDSSKDHTVTALSSATTSRATMRYTTMRDSTLAVGYSCDRYTSGTWYSYGVSLGWNGSGYTSFYTYQSPNQNS